MNAYFLAEHPNAGQALFTRLDDAKEWCDYQNQNLSFAPHWISGGEHGWWAQRDPNGAIFDWHATVKTLALDAHLRGTGDGDDGEEW